MFRAPECVRNGNGRLYATDAPRAFHTRNFQFYCRQSRHFGILAKRRSSLAIPRADSPTLASIAAMEAMDAAA